MHECSCTRTGKAIRFSEKGVHALILRETLLCLQYVKLRLVLQRTLAIRLIWGLEGAAKAGELAELHDTYALTRKIVTSLS